jgi:predicted RNA-binding protein
MEDIDLAYSFMISLIFLSLYTIQKTTFIYNKYRESEEFIEEMYKKFKELEENEDGTEMP